MLATERLWRTRGGERLVRDGDLDAAILAYAAGDEIAKADQGLIPGEANEQSPEGDGPFDPSKHTVQQVLQYLEGTDTEETLRVFDAEVAAAARKGILDQREAILDSKKESTPEPEQEHKATPAPANKAQRTPADKAKG